jgi:hypothetical protein
MDLLFREHLWPGLAMWTALYISDYALTPPANRKLSVNSHTHP